LRALGLARGRHHARARLTVSGSPYRWRTKSEEWWYAVVVPELRTCRVSFQDAEGIAHSVEVTAQSTFEAAALAIKAFRGAEWIEGGPGVGQFWRSRSRSRSQSTGSRCENSRHGWRRMAGRRRSKRPSSG
jgi:hypothetical protein